MSAKSDYKTPYQKKRVEHSTLVKAYLAAYDVIAVSLAYFLALLVRFDLRFSYIPTIYLEPWLRFAPIYAVICILVFWRLRLYRSIWRFASFTELQRITIATVVTTVLHIVGVTVTLQVLPHISEYTVSRMPLSYYLMGPIIQFFLITGIRFSYRFILLLRSRNTVKANKNVMVNGSE